jgi:hypothetical protein
VKPRNSLFPIPVNDDLRQNPLQRDTQERSSTDNASLSSDGELRSPSPASSVDDNENLQEPVERETPGSLNWDFQLPVLPKTSSIQPGGADGSAGFSMKSLLAAIQHNATYTEIQSYLGHFSHGRSSTVRNRINDMVEGFPAMFYVVARNSDTILRLMVQYGGNVNATWGTPPVPLLVFTIINSQTIEHETTACVATLLSLGADVSTVPKSFYTPFDEDLPAQGPIEEQLQKDWEVPERQWSQTENTRRLFAETLNITQRYYLDRSSKLERPSERQKWVANRNDSGDIFGIPYFLIGQTAASDLLTKHFLHYMLRQHTEPLVLVFAGTFNRSHFRK